MKRVSTVLLICIAFILPAQIQQTKEVSTSFERELAHIREVHRLDMEAMKTALNLQATEYERRLTQLNHEAARLALMVPRDEYEKFVTRTELEIREIRTWQDNMTGKIAVSVGIIGLVLFAMNYFKKSPKDQT